MLQTKLVEKIKKISRSKLIFSKIVPFCEIMWENIVQPGRPQTTIWRTRTARWITKATNTQSEYVTLITFQLQQWYTNAPQY